MVGVHGGLTWWVDMVGCYKRCTCHTELFFVCFQAAHPRPRRPYPASTLSCRIIKDDEGPGDPAGDVMAALMKRAFETRRLFTVTDDKIAWHGAVFYKENFRAE